MSVWIETDPLYSLSPSQFVMDYFNNRRIYMKELYKGLVVELYSMATKKGYDLAAIVYDKDKEKFIHFKYANQDTYLPNSAFIDATDDIFDLYKKELGKRTKKYLQYMMDVKKSYKGITFKVVRGNKIPVGTKGFCIWSGMSKWGKMRLGIKDKDHNVHWIDLKNCEIYND